MKYECINAYYFRSLNKIGGIESHLRYLAMKYGKDYDLTVFYKNADPEQLNALKTYVDCCQLTQNDFVECRNLFCCFNREILDQCRAEKKYLVLHGDYKNMLERGQLHRENLPVDKRIDEYLGVSQLVCDSWEELTGIKATNLYEPVVLNGREKSLMFLSATRLTPEKGWRRMETLAKVLDDAGVNYTWLIYTNTPQAPTKNMVFVKPRLDITDKIGAYDAFIQLSDNEGFCLSIVEALMNGVPVIATKLPVLEELGLNDSNSILLPFDMSEIPVDRIRNIKELKFSYTPPEDKWASVLNEEKNDRLITVRASNGYKKLNISDGQLGFIPSPGYEWQVTRQRFYDLVAFGEKHRVKMVDKV